jgi:hypothetical protein
MLQTLNKPNCQKDNFGLKVSSSHVINTYTGTNIILNSNSLTVQIVEVPCTIILTFYQRNEDLIFIRLRDLFHILLFKGKKERLKRFLSSKNLWDFQTMRFPTKI